MGHLNNACTEDSRQRVKCLFDSEMHISLKNARFDNKKNAQNIAKCIINWEKIMHMSLQNARYIAKCLLQRKKQCVFQWKCTLHCKMPVLMRKCTGYLVEKSTVMWKLPITWSIFLPVSLKNAYSTTKQRMYVALNNARVIAKCPLWGEMHDVYECGNACPNVCNDIRSLAVQTEGGGHTIE